MIFEFAWRFALGTNYSPSHANLLIRRSETFRQVGGPSSMSSMTGWEISRHPEWDMMYAVGLTVREISDLCHWQCATIHAHFQSRERYKPGTRAKHEAALAARGMDRPTAQWRTNLNEVLEFQKTYSRLPRHHGDDTERRLHRWILKQRRAYRNKSMSIPKTVLLEDLTGWNIDAHQQELDETWRARLTSLIEFAAANHRIPRYKNYSTEAERVLGVWLHVQHQKRAEGALVPWRLEMMDGAFLHWQSRM